MNWRIDFSRDAQRFLDKEHISKKEVLNLLKRAILKFRGEDININMRKLKGKWEGFYRIRRGKIRIIAEFDFERSAVFIEQIDWRGNAYK